MRTRLLVATLFIVGTAFVGGSGGAAPGDDMSVDVPGLDQQAQIQQAKLVEHHARVVEQGERVAESQLDYQARVARQLGDRAPTETIPPMATVPPLEAVSPTSD